MLTINQERFLAMMREQAEIGKTAGGGLSRPALFEDDLKARAWFQEQAQAHGLEYAQDGAGNQSAILRSADPDAKTLLIGSHLDSVVDGGRFDGALGVVAALEAVLVIKEAEYALPFHLEVINFTDEEGTLIGLMGSSAISGLLTEDALQNPRGGRDALLAAYANIGIDDASVLAAKRDPKTLLGYLEVHIEQGTRLIDQQLNIGVVDAIVGIRSYALSFIGEAAHAGTMPITKRKDAMRGVSHFISQAFQIVPRHYDPGVVNFGRVELQPGAYNIVPAQVELGMEFRHGDMTTFDQMEKSLLQAAEQAAGQHGLTLKVRELGRAAPSPMAEPFLKAVESAADALSLSHTRMLSFAGHDAQALAQITNSAMFFVPSVEGISHNSQEFTSDEDCINAANVMLQSILQLAESS